MKKVFYLILVGVLGFVFLGLGNDTPIEPTVVYEDVTLSGGFQSGHFPEVWDLTKCSLVISFTYDANGLVDDSGAHAWAAFGIRQIGYSDFNPTWQDEGAGVWLATDYDGNVATFDGNSDDNDNGRLNKVDLDLDDKLILQRGGGCGEGGYWYWDGTNWVLIGPGYNLPSIPPIPGNNHRIWWDRDGVDPWQNDETANTNGIYCIEISLNATSNTSGEAYMTINSLDQGFETDGKWNTIELTPAGMTFTGDMTQMQVFYGLYGYGATHTVDFQDIEIEGCLGMIFIDGCDTGVTDQVLEDESTISGCIAECAANAKNHGEFLRCVASLTRKLQKEGIITGEEEGAILSCAAQANIPK